MAGDRSLREEQRSGDFPVRPALGNQACNATFGGRQPLLPPAATDAPELAPSLRDPGRGLEPLETLERELNRVIGASLLPFASPDDAEPEQRPSTAERVTDLLVLRHRTIEEGLCANDISPGGRDEAAASGGLGEHPLAGHPRGV